jgi:hypothetical protein
VSWNGGQRSDRDRGGCQATQGRGLGGLEDAWGS